MLNRLPALPLAQVRHVAVKVSLLLACVISPFAQGQQANCKVPEIYFVNGVWNSAVGGPEGAFASAAALEATLAKAVPEKFGPIPRDHKHVILVWNPSTDMLVLGQLSDVFEVISAKEGLQNKLSMPFDAIDALIGPVWSSQLGKAIRGQLDDNFHSEQAEKAVSTAEGIFLRKLQGKVPIVVVAHSQGNIVANKSIERILSQFPDLKTYISVAGIGVAADQPISFNGAPFTGYSYLTSDADRIIGWLGDDALKANFTAISPDRLSMRHAFVGYYLSEADFGRLASKPESLPNQNVSFVIDLIEAAYDNVACASTSLEVKSHPPQGRTFNLTGKVTKSDPTKLAAWPEVKPAGKVNFKLSSGQLICSATLAPDGTGTCEARFNGPEGKEFIFPSYEGDERFLPSQSQALELKISDRLIDAPTSFSLPYRRVSRMVFDQSCVIEDYWQADGNAGTSIRCAQDTEYSATGDFANNIYEIYWQDGAMSMIRTKTPGGTHLDLFTKVGEAIVESQVGGIDVPYKPRLDAYIGLLTGSEVACKLPALSPDLARYFGTVEVRGLDIVLVSDEIGERIIGAVPAVPKPKLPVAEAVDPLGKFGSLTYWDEARALFQMIVSGSDGFFTSTMTEASGAENQCFRVLKAP